MVIQGIRSCGFLKERLKPVSKAKSFNWDQFWVRVSDGDLVNYQTIRFWGVRGSFTRLLVFRGEWWTSVPLRVKGTIDFKLSFRPGMIRIEDPDNLPVY